MVKFTHYLVTRFNIPVNNWEKDKTGHPTLDDHWMQHRISLFKKYCIPTIASQLEKKFLWIVYCDVNTNSVYRQQIEDAVSVIPAAMIRTVADPAEMLSDLRHLISNATTPYVITSRLDNDDGLGKNYIRTVGEHFKESDKLLLNPEGGILYDTREKVMTQMKNSQRNHYTSLIEETKSPGELLTVLGFPHDNPPDDVQIENIPGQYYWLKIIHERNVKSQIKGKPFFNMNNHFYEEMDKIYFPVSFGNTIKYILKSILHKLKTRNH